MDLLVVIVNYNSGPLAAACLRSLTGEAARVPGMRVCVTDNRSPDGSIEVVRRAIDDNGWAAWAEVMPLESNGGFAYGNNAAIRKYMASDEKPRYVLLLNPDTLVHAGAMSELLRFMDERPEVGIVGARLLDADGRPQGSAHKAISPLSEMDGGFRLGVVSRALRPWIIDGRVRQEPHACDWVSGAAMMVRREVFDEIGLIDEGYFLYFEELDFCVRAQRAGWETWYVPTAQVTHLEGQSTGIKARKTRRARYWYESRRRYFVKTIGVMGLVAADMLWAAGRMTLPLQRLAGLGDKTANDPAHFAWDLLVGDLRAIARGDVWRIGRGGNP